MPQIVPIPYCTNPEQLFFAIRDLPGAIWLDSGKPGSDYGRFDIFSALPTATLTTQGNNTVITQNGQTEYSSDDPFTLARNLLSSMPAVSDPAQDLPFSGGLAGYFGYDLGKPLENIPCLKPSITTLPHMRLGLYHWSLIIDHRKQQAHMIFLKSCPSESSRLIRERLHQANARHNNRPEFSLDGVFTPSMTAKEYQKAIVRIQDYIHAGDCYQVNFAQHFSAPFHGDPLGAYLILRRALPSPFSAYLYWDNQAILSLSPERFLKVTRHGNAETRPIKGTIRRGGDTVSDQENVDQLLNSQKDQAENLMIVDLMRNDFGKTCQPGTISVPELFSLESFSNVHHLVSTVTGKLQPHTDGLNLLKGCFPGGSITGAPKRRAMEVIEELETCQRSAYCGSVGYLSRCGRMDTNIAIRTLIADAGHLHCWGGGGIVADSNAEAEYQESLDKVQVLMTSLHG